MHRDDELLVSELEKLEQRKRTKRAQEYRRQEEARKSEIRRQIIVGTLFLRYFPEFVSLQPRRTHAENELEFARLGQLFKSFAAHKEWGADFCDEARLSTAP